VKIYLKYCGGCNPEIDRGHVTKEIEQLMASESIHFEYVKEITGADIILLVNGCPHACKEEELNLSPEPVSLISIQGNRVRFKPFLENEIPRIVVEQIKALRLL